MAEEFSYASDIAPMQPRFISDVSGSRNLSTRMKQNIVGGFLDKQLAQAQELAKIEDMRNTAKMRDIQYKSSLLALEEQKRKAAEEKEFYTTGLPELNAKLQEVVAEPDREKKIGMISSIGVNFAKVISDNPVAKQAFSAASYGVNIGTPARPSKTIGDFLILGGNTDDLKARGYDVSDPKTLDMPAPPDLLQIGISRQLKLSEEKKQQEKKDVATEKQAEALSRATSKQFSDNFTLLNDPEKDPLPTTSRLVKNFGNSDQKNRLTQLEASLASISGADGYQKKKPIIDEMRKIGIEINNRLDPLAVKKQEETPASDAEVGFSLFKPIAPK